MDVIKKLKAFIHQYKYIFLVVVVGVLLMLMPIGEDNQEKDGITDVQTKTDESFENQLAAILCNVSGAGSVEVLLSLMEGEEIIYQTDINANSASNSESSNEKVVTITDSQRNQQGLIKQTIPATYRGAIIVCEGAEDPSVRLNIISAVSKLTGLGADKISVLKMK